MAEPSGELTEKAATRLSPRQVYEQAKDAKLEELEELAGGEWDDNEVATIAAADQLQRERSEFIKDFETARAEAATEILAAADGSVVEYIEAIDALVELFEIPEPEASEMRNAIVSFVDLVEQLPDGESLAVAFVQPIGNGGRTSKTRIRFGHTKGPIELKGPLGGFSRSTNADNFQLQLKVPLSGVVDLTGKNGTVVEATKEGQDEVALGLIITPGKTNIAVTVGVVAELDAETKMLRPFQVSGENEAKGGPSGPKLIAGDAAIQELLQRMDRARFKETKSSLALSAISAALNIWPYGKTSANKPRDRFELSDRYNEKVIGLFGEWVKRYTHDSKREAGATVITIKPSLAEERDLIFDPALQAAIDFSVASLTLALKDALNGENGLVAKYMTAGTPNSQRISEAELQMIIDQCARFVIREERLPDNLTVLSTSSLIYEKTYERAVEYARESIDKRRKNKGLTRRQANEAHSDLTGKVRARKAGLI